jgi:hypothetical protein
MRRVSIFPLAYHRAKATALNQACWCHSYARYSELQTRDFEGAVDGGAPTENRPAQVEW